MMFFRRLLTGGKTGPNFVSNFVSNLAQIVSKSGLWSVVRGRPEGQKQISKKSALSQKSQQKVSNLEEKVSKSQQKSAT